MNIADKIIMNEISFLKINESHISIDAYKAIMEHYTSFLKFFYGNKIDISVKEGSQILQATKNESIHINDNQAHDFYNLLTEKGFDKKSYQNYQKPLYHLYCISNIKEKYQLQEFNLFFNHQETFINKKFNEKLSLYDKADIKELTSIRGTIHLVTDKDENLKIKVTDKEDNKEIIGIIKTESKEQDKKLFENIRIRFFGKDVLVSGYLYRNQITFDKKQIEILNVKELESTKTPLSSFRGIMNR